MYSVLESIEGVIKYHHVRVSTSPLSPELVEPLRAARSRAFLAGFIGVDSHGVGYGNISMRTPDGFAISGTQTGGIYPLPYDQYAEVIETDLNRNWIVSRGAVEPSSEAMTHGMLYRLDTGINGVLHIHHAPLWRRLINVLPTTAADVPYGTVEMAEEIDRLWNERQMGTNGTIVMAGHQDGILFFGEEIMNVVATALIEAGIVVAL